MTRKLFLLLCALLTTVGTWAAEDAASATYSDPYTVTVSNGNFENGLTGWTVEANNVGFVSHDGNGGHIAEIYNKKNAVHYIKRTITGLSAGHYRLYFLAGARGNTDTDKVYAYIGTAKKGVVGEPFASYVIDYDLASDGDVEIGLTTASDHAAEWVAIDNVELKYYGPTAAYNTALNQAYLEAGSNMTSFIRGADFSDGISCFPQTSGTRGNSQTGSYAMESWNNNDVTYAQTIALPNGKYRITVDMISGNDTKQAYLFASSGTTTVNSSAVSAQSASGRDNYTNMCEDVTGKTLTIDNFAVTNGSLTLGIKDPSTGGWVVFDNFTLTAIEKDVTFSINNAAVTSATGWTEGHTASGQQYTGAPDNTYLDNNSGTKNMSQDVNLPAGYYLLKCATRASTNANANVYVYSYATEANVGSTNNHKEGNSGNLLDGGWAWTYVPFTLAEAGKVGIGFWSNCSGTWAGADDFHLTYYTSELAMKQGHLAQVVADANAWAEKLTTTPSLEEQLSASAPSCSTVEECNTAITNLTNVIAYARATSPVYPEFVRIKNGANSIKNVATTSEEACETLASAITTQTAAAESATTAAGITTATSALKTAIRTYINGAEPANESEYFDITCLMANPDFATGDASGWTDTGVAPGVSWSNCEYYEKEFDINQTVTGLPTGSYSLSVQAFQRPGAAGTVYNDYIGGTDNASSVLYINSITSKVKNIAADAQDNYKLGDGTNFDWPNDSRVGSDPYKYLPNSQQGAKLYFDANLYDATCAAVVTDADEGSLKLGFKSTKDHVSFDWTIFDNFRLYYYGSSLLVYYKQYLPQLQAEVTADLSNLAYQSAFVSSENEALEDALAENPASETEEAYKAVIDDIVDAQTAFRAAVVTYDAIVAAKSSSLTKKTANIGTGVFQYNETTNNTLFNAYETAKSDVDGYTFTTSSTAADAQALVDALNTAISNYQNQALNAPDAEKRYVLSLDGRGALTFQPATTEGDYGLPFMDANSNSAQNFMFEATATANVYKLYFYDIDGNKRYICTRAQYGEGGTGTAGIRTFVDGAEGKEALLIKIQATNTANVFNMLNTERNDEKLGSSGGDFYTADNYSSWSISEASKATANLKVSNGKLGTFIAPFDVVLPTGVKAYSATSDAEKVTLTKEYEGGETLPAGTPVIIYGDEVNVNDNFEGYSCIAGNKTVGALTGMLVDKTVPAYAYVLQTQGGIQSFYQLETSATASFNRCYVTANSVGAGARLAIVFEDDDPTAIKAIEAAEAEAEGGLKDGKYIIDGKIVIVKNGVKYGANGQKLN